MDGLCSFRPSEATRGRGGDGRRGNTGRRAAQRVWAATATAPAPPPGSSWCAARGFPPASRTPAGRSSATACACRCVERQQRALERRQPIERHAREVVVLEMIVGVEEREVPEPVAAHQRAPLRRVGGIDVVVLAEPVQRERDRKDEEDGDDARRTPRRPPKTHQISASADRWNPIDSQRSQRDACAAAPQDTWTSPGARRGSRSGTAPACSTAA